MTERRHGASLDVEPLPRFRIHGEIGGHRLDGHRSIQPDVAGAIHLAHAAGAQRFENFVRAEVSPRGQHHKERADYSVHTPSEFPEGGKAVKALTQARRASSDAGSAVPRSRNSPLVAAARLEWSHRRSTRDPAPRRARSGA